MSNPIASKSGSRHSLGISAAMATLLGLAAAFGAAACCALPLLFAALGLETAWIGALALFAAPYRSVFLAAGALGLAGGALFLWRARRATVCSPDNACINPAAYWLTFSTLLIGSTLLYFGYMYV